jgi:hypothetical protein
MSATQTITQESTSCFGNWHSSSFDGISHIETKNHA